MTGLEIWLLAVGLGDGLFRRFYSQRNYIETRPAAPYAGDGHGFGFSGFDASAGMDRRQFFQPPDIDHWIAFGILAFLGGRMIMESFKRRRLQTWHDPTSLKVVLALAVATSIDALAVGVSFAFLGIKQFSNSFPIEKFGFVSFALSMVGPDVRHPFRMWHSLTARRTLGRIILIIIRYQDIDRTSLL